MAKIVKSLSLDVSRQNRIQAVVAKQYDKDSRFLKIQLTDEGEPIVVDLSSVVTINASRADNTSKAFAGEVNEDGTVTVPITYWMLELDDKVGCDVSVVDAQGRKLSTLNFTIEVEHSNHSGDDISEDENYDLLVTLLAEVAEAKDAEAKRVVAENARVTAETNRVNAETARDTAEKERAAAEHNRAAAWANAEGIQQIVIEDLDNDKQYGYQLKIEGGKPKLYLDEI
jgi:nucleoid-associated protein YgaU